VKFTIKKKLPPLKIHKLDKARGLKARDRSGRGKARGICSGCSRNRIIFSVEGFEDEEKIWCYDCGSLTVKEAVKGIKRSWRMDRKAARDRKRG
jgi:hypothetical protein